MGIEPAILMAAASTGLSLMQGMSAQSEAAAQTKALYAKTTADIQEQTRQSVRQAAQEKTAAEGARRQQKLAYMASGVSLSGSPLLVLEETRQKGLANAQEIMDANTAYTKSTGLETGAQAKSFRSQGRQAFMTGVGSAFKTVGAYYADK